MAMWLADSRAMDDRVWRMNRNRSATDDHVEVARTYSTKIAVLMHAVK